jgi:chorismate dehydratase
VSKIKISCVNYTNSLPFIEGLKKNADFSKIELFLDNPAECYSKLEKSEVDIGLVPVIALNKLQNSRIISPFCIGTKGEVKSVILVSNCELRDIKKIYLDYQSRSSVQLVRVLTRHFWKIQPEFTGTKIGFEEMELPPQSGLVVIGDRSFSFYQKKELKITDLGTAWLEFSGRPFVFACWISRTDLDPGLVSHFNDCLRRGIDSRSEVINGQKQAFEGADIDPEVYFYRNINYNFDRPSREGLELFLNLVR